MILGPVKDTGKTVVLVAPELGGEVSRHCPDCGRRATTHGYRDRVVNDWETTHFRCARLRCCGRTFLSTPMGISPRSRYSDRVVVVARILVALGVSLRNCVEILGQVGVPMTRESIRLWSRGLRYGSVATARIASEASGSVAIRLKDDLWIVVDPVASRLSDAMA